MTTQSRATLADLRAWQEIAERHSDKTFPQRGCLVCVYEYFPCPDRRLADAALDRLDALWGTP